MGQATDLDKDNISATDKDNIICTIKENHMLLYLKVKIEHNCYSLHAKHVHVFIYNVIVYEFMASKTGFHSLCRELSGTLSSSFELKDPIPGVNDNLTRRPQAIRSI